MPKSAAQKARARDGMIHLEEQTAALRRGWAFQYEQVPRSVVRSALVFDSRHPEAKFSPCSTVHSKVIGARKGKQLVTTAGLAVSSAVAVVQASVRQRASAIHRTNAAAGSKMQQNGRVSFLPASPGARQEAMASSAAASVDSSSAGSGASSFKPLEHSSTHPGLDEAASFAHQLQQQSSSPSEKAAGHRSRARAANTRAAGLSGTGKGKRQTETQRHTPDSRGITIPTRARADARSPASGTSPQRIHTQEAVLATAPPVDLGRELYATSRALSRAQWRDRLSALCGSLLRVEQQFPLAWILVRCFGIRDDTPYDPKFGEMFLDVLLSIYKAQQIDALTQCMQTSPVAALLHKAASIEAAGLSSDVLQWSQDTRDSLADGVLELVAESSGFGQQPDTEPDSILRRLQAAYSLNAEPCIPVDKFFAMVLRAWSLESDRIDRLLQLQLRLGVDTPLVERLQGELAASLCQVVEEQVGRPQEAEGPVAQTKALGRGWRRRTATSGGVEDALAAAAAEWMADNTHVPSEQEMQSALSHGSRGHHAFVGGTMPPIAASRAGMSSPRSTWSPAREAPRRGAAHEVDSESDESLERPPAVIASSRGATASPRQDQDARQSAAREPGSPQLAGSASPVHAPRFQQSRKDETAVGGTPDGPRSSNKKGSSRAKETPGGTPGPTGGWQPYRPGRPARRSQPAAAWPVLETASMGAMRQVCSQLIVRLRKEMDRAGELETRLHHREGLIRAQASMIRSMQEGAANARLKRARRRRAQAQAQAQARMNASNPTAHLGASSPARSRSGDGRGHDGLPVPIGTAPQPSEGGQEREHARSREQSSSKAHNIGGERASGEQRHYAEGAPGRDEAMHAVHLAEAAALGSGYPLSSMRVQQVDAPAHSAAGSLGAMPMQHASHASPQSEIRPSADPAGAAREGRGRSVGHASVLHRDDPQEDEALLGMAMATQNHGQSHPE